MADQVVEKWGLDLDTGEAQRSIAQFGDQMTKSFAVGTLAVKGLEAAIGLMTKAIHTGWSEMMETQVATIRLNAAVQAFGASSGATSDQLVQLAEKMSRLTGYESDQLVTLQSTMLMYGVASNKIEAYTRASVELANVTGGDLASAFMRLQRMEATGNVDRTMKTIPGLNALTKAQLENGEAVDVINEKWGQFIGLRMEGLPGEINKLTLAWKELSEAFVGLSMTGGVLSSVLEKVTSLLRAQQALLQDGEFRKFVLSGILFAQGDVFGSSSGSGVPGAIKGVAPIPGTAGGGDFTVPGLTINAEKAAKDAARRRKEAAAQASRTADARQRNADIIAGIGGTDYGPGQEMAIGMASDETDARLAFEERLAVRKMRAQELLTKHFQEQAEYRAEVAAKEQERISATYEKMGEAVGVIFEGMAGTMTDVLFSAIDGQKVALDAIVADFLKATGKQLIAMGTKDMLEGGARAIRSYGVDPTAYQLMGQGAIEIAAGAGLAAGGAGIAAQPGFTGLGEKGGAGAAGGKDSFSGSSGFRANSGGGEGDVYNITITGPVLGEHHFGQIVQKAIDEKNRRGL